MPTSATKDKDGSHAQWWETGVKSLGGEEVGFKETEATENQDGKKYENMEVERRNRKISSRGGEEEDSQI